MRIPLTGYAKREIALYGGMSLAATAATAVVLAFFVPPLWPLAAIPAVITGWVFSFFRDPHRRVPQGDRLLVAPADGRVTAVETIEAPEELGQAGPALRISIFLSVFNCHLNRAPCAATVEKVIYRQGAYVNALRGDSAMLNEQNILILRSDVAACPLLVRQVSGAIARRIVCAARPGDHLAAGERFGMIKFGSRTDIIVPTSSGVQAAVNVGDRVKAGLSVLGHFA